MDCFLAGSPARDVTDRDKRAPARTAGLTVPPRQRAADSSGRSDLLSRARARGPLRGGGEVSRRYPRQQARASAPSESVPNDQRAVSTPAYLAAPGVSSAPSESVTRGTWAVSSPSSGPPRQAPSESVLLVNYRPPLRSYREGSLMMLHWVARAVPHWVPASAHTLLVAPCRSCRCSLLQAPALKYSAAHAVHFAVLLKASQTN